MTDELTDLTLDELVRSADPVRHDALPTAAETDVALRRMLAAGPGPTKTRRRLPPLLAATTVTVAALAAALVLLVGATTSPPAFAVTRNPDGTVTVRLSRLSALAPADVASANARLAAMGVRARIVEGARGSLVRCGTARVVTFQPRRIPPHETLILTADNGGHLSLAAAAARVRDMALALAYVQRARPAGRGPRTTVTGRVIPVRDLEPTVRDRMMAMMALCRAAGQVR
jgi:hypothetical protein